MLETKSTKNRKRYAVQALAALLLLAPVPLAANEAIDSLQSGDSPPPNDNNVIDSNCYNSNLSPAYYFNFGSRFGNEGPEAYTDLILPFYDNGQNLVFLNPRASIAEEGQNNLNLGLGLRRMVRPDLVMGVNVFTDSFETKSGNRLSQWGAGLEILSDYVDFRANWYDASSSKKKNGEYVGVETETSSVTTAKTTSRTGARTTTTITTGAPAVTKTKTGEQTVPGSVKTAQTTVNLQPKVELSGGGKPPSDPYAIGHEIRYDLPAGTAVKTTPRSRTDTVTTARVAETFDVTTTRPVTTRRDTTYTTTAKTTYRTETTHTTTTKLFERFEAGMDGWDAELGFRLPWNGPETRLFGGWYDYDNPFGEDVKGWKARLEVKPGPWLSLDAELYEDDRLHGSDWFVGFRAQIPLSRDLSWKDFKEGLFSRRPRCLDERMRGEMVGRDGAVHAAQSPWSENLAKRRVEKRVEAEERTVTRTSRRTESSVETKIETTRATETSEGEVVLDSMQGPVVEGTPTTVGPGPAQTITLAKNITFVDGKHQGASDGTAANPYVTLQEAADSASATPTGQTNKAGDAGEGHITIFVYEPGTRDVQAGGKVFMPTRTSTQPYTKGVEVHPGQTLTSIVRFNVNQHPTITEYKTKAPPKLDATEGIKPYTRPTHYTAVLLHENTVLERINITTKNMNNAMKGHGEGIVVAPTKNGTVGDVWIKNSEIDSSGCGIVTIVHKNSGSELGNLKIEDIYIDTGKIGTLKNKNVGVYTEVTDGTKMGDLTIIGGTIKAESHAVRTWLRNGEMGDVTITNVKTGPGSTKNYHRVLTEVEKNSKMAGMTVTGAKTGIQRGTAHAVQRECNGTCTGTLTVDGWTTTDPGTVWWDGPDPNDMSKNNWTQPNP